MSLKILLVNTGILSVPPQRGGAIELHTYYLANELASLGNEVHYVTNANENASFVPGVILHRLSDLPFSFQGGYLETMSSYAIGGVLASCKALTALRTHRYDVVHGHGNVSTALLLPLAKKSRCVFTVHNPTPQMLISSSSIKQALRTIAFSVFDLRILRNVDSIITVSEYLKKEIVSRLGIETEKVNVIVNGVDIKNFKPLDPDSARIRRKYGLPEEFALFVGRLVEQKGVHFLIKSLAGTKLHAVIVGGGPLFSHLQTLCRRLGVESQVHFVGVIPPDELTKFYAEATVFVVPSLAEGLPLVGLEAMASGLPIVGTRVSGVDEIINHGYNGFVIRLGDIEQLRQSLVQLFEDSSLRSTMGAHSRKTAEAQFSWEQVAKQTFELYKSLAF